MHQVICHLQALLLVLGIPVFIVACAFSVIAAFVFVVWLLEKTGINFEANLPAWAEHLGVVLVVVFCVLALGFLVHEFAIDICARGFSTVLAGFK